MQIHRKPASLRRFVGVLASGLSLLAFGPGCDRYVASSTLEIQRPCIFVSVLPQAFLAQRIAGEHFSVEVMVGPGQSPHVFEPTSRQMTALSSARLYFTTGIPFEQTLVEKISPTFKSLRFVDTTAGLTLRPGEDCEHDRSHDAEHHDAAEHEHDHDDHDPAHHDHDHGAPDPHVWLNPLFAEHQARVMTDALIAADAAHAADYERNFAALSNDLRAADAHIADALAPFKGRAFFVFHPAYGYFADRYGLIQTPVEEAGKEPSARRLVALIDRAKASGVKLIFVQPQFPSKCAEAVAEAIGGAVMPMDDLARDYLANLNDMADKIARSMRKDLSVPQLQAVDSRGDAPS